MAAYVGARSEHEKGYFEVGGFAQVDWGDLMVVLIQRTVLRGAMHIVGTHAGVVLLDHIVVRCKSNGVRKFEVPSHGPTQENYFAFR